MEIKVRRREESAKNPVEFHIGNSTFLPVTMGRHRGLYNTLRNRATGMSLPFRFTTRAPTNVSWNFPELWTTSSFLLKSIY